MLLISFYGPQSQRPLARPGLRACWRDTVLRTLVAGAAQASESACSPCIAGTYSTSSGEPFSTHLYLCIESNGGSSRVGTCLCYCVDVSCVTEVLQQENRGIAANSGQMHLGT
jgi:hypothetical protein